MDIASFGIGREFLQAINVRSEYDEDLNAILNVVSTYRDEDEKVPLFQLPLDDAYDQSTSGLRSMQPNPSNNGSSLKAIEGKVSIGSTDCSTEDYQKVYSEWQEHIGSLNGSDEEDFLVRPPIGDVENNGHTQINTRSRNYSTSSFSGPCIPPDLMIGNMAANKDNDMENGLTLQPDDMLNPFSEDTIKYGEIDFGKDQMSDIYLETKDEKKSNATKDVKIFSQDEIDVSSLKIIDSNKETISANNTVCIDGCDIQLPTGSIVLAVVDESGSLVPLPVDTETLQNKDATDNCENEAGKSIEPKQPIMVGEISNELKGEILEANLSHKNKVVFENESVLDTSSDDFVDVETVEIEQTPVLNSIALATLLEEFESSDPCSKLLDEFEASDVVNGKSTEPSSKDNFELSYPQTPVKHLIENLEPTMQKSRPVELTLNEKSKEEKPLVIKVQTKNPHAKIVSNHKLEKHQSIKDALPKEVIEKIRASGKRRTTQMLSEALIPPQKGRARKFQENLPSIRAKSTDVSIPQLDLEGTSTQNEVMFVRDHDYCFSPAKNEHSSNKNIKFESSKCSQLLNLSPKSPLVGERKIGINVENETRKDSGVESGDISDASTEMDFRKEKQIIDNNLLSPVMPLGVVKVEPTDSEEGCISDKISMDSSLEILDGKSIKEEMKPKKKLKLSEYRKRLHETDSGCLSPLVSCSANSSVICSPPVNVITQIPIIKKPKLENGESLMSSNITNIPVSVVNPLSYTPPYHPSYLSEDGGHTPISALPICSTPIKPIPQAKENARMSIKVKSVSVSKDVRISRQRERTQKSAKLVENPVKEISSLKRVTNERSISNRKISTKVISPIKIPFPIKIKEEPIEIFDGPEVEIISEVQKPRDIVLSDNLLAQRYTISKMPVSSLGHSLLFNKKNKDKDSVSADRKSNSSGYSDSFSCSSSSVSSTSSISSLTSNSSYQSSTSETPQKKQSKRRRKNREECGRYSSSPSRSRSPRKSSANIKYKCGGESKARQHTHRKSARRWSRERSLSNDRSRSKSRRKHRSKSRRRSRSISKRGSHRSRSQSYSRSSYSSSSYSRSRSRSRYRSGKRRENFRSGGRSSRSYSRARSSRRNRSASPWRQSRDRLYQRSYDESGRDGRQIEERKVIYIGKIAEGTKKEDLRARFKKFGPIEGISVHFRENADNYGFVTFKYSENAVEAIDHGNDDLNLPRYTLCFGGRRNFCKVRYSDLDSQIPEMRGYDYDAVGLNRVGGPVFPPSYTMDYDALLRDALRMKR